MTKRVSEIEARQTMEAAGMKPLEPYPGRLKKWKCKCLICGEVGYTSYSTVQRGGRGCKPCAIRSTSEKKRIKPEEVSAILAKADLRAIEKYSSSAKALLCECLNCGNYVAPTLSDVKRGARCEYCRRTKIDPKYALELAKSAGLHPLEDFRSALLTWKCLHIECGEIIYPHWTTLKSGGSGCIKCRGKNTSLVRKIKDSEALRIMNQANFQPLEPYRDSVSNWRSLCKSCSNISYPRLNNVKNGTGCIYCCNKGLSLSEEAFIYLIFHPGLQAHKVGVGGIKVRLDRIEQHRKRGWILFRTLDVSSGKIALEIEQKILDFLFLDCGLSAFLSADEMPQGGHTETVDASEIDLVTIWTKITEFSRLNGEAKVR